MLHEHFLIPFGTELWWKGLFAFSLILILPILIGRSLRKTNQEEKFRKVLFYIFLFREFAFYGYLIYTKQFNIQESLPLHLCNISYIVLLFLFYKPKAFTFEFLILLGFGGALQGILTPELTHGYSTYRLVDYYVAHSAIVLSPFYAYFVLGMRPREYSWLKIWITAHLLLLSVGIINWFLNSNYIYLCVAPKVDNPLVTGSYPSHLYGFELFGTIHVLLMYYLFKPGWGLNRKLILLDE